MQQSPEFLLFTKGIYNGETKAPETVFKTLKASKPEDTKTYLDVLAVIYKSAAADKTNPGSTIATEFARIGVAMIGGINDDNNGRGYLMVVPPFLANTSMFESTLDKSVIETIRPKFRHMSFLLNQNIEGSMIPAALRGDPHKEYTFIRNAGANLTAESAAWRIMYWGAAPGAFPKARGDFISDQKLLTENSLYFVFVSMLAQYKQTLPIGTFIPQKASISEINELKMRPLYSGFGKEVRVLYVKPTPTTDTVVRAVQYYRQKMPGTQELDVSEAEEKLIRLNQRCALGRCQPTAQVHARGLYVPRHEKPAQSTPNFDALLNCNADDYTKAQLERMAAQVNIATEPGESDTALCRRIKEAVKRMY